MGLDRTRPQRFNPRPPFPGGDARPLALPASWLVRFQSAPPVSGRRCPLLDAINRVMFVFQSAPPVSGRRCRSLSRAVTALYRVSIRAPRFREAMPGGWFRSDKRWTVSIRAPRFREAMPGYPCRGPLLMTSFNPRPPFPGGDAPEPDTDRGEVVWFQSAPPVSGRRCHFADIGTSISGRFNPRPPFPGGDAARVQRNDVGASRFNPRPPFPGGDAAKTHLLAIRQYAGFNPRPPFPGGDAGSDAA